MVHYLFRLILNYMYSLIHQELYDCKLNVCVFFCYIYRKIIQFLVAVRNLEQVAQICKKAHEAAVAASKLISQGQSVVSAKPTTMPTHKPAVLPIDLMMSAYYCKYCRYVEFSVNRLMVCLHCPTPRLIPKQIKMACVRLCTRCSYCTGAADNTHSHWVLRTCYHYYICLRLSLVLGQCE